MANKDDCTLTVFQLRHLWISQRWFCFNSNKRAARDARHFKPKPQALPVKQELKMIIEKIESRAVRRVIGEELWRVRRLRNLSLSQLSKQIGFPVNVLDKAEQGRGVPVYILIKLLIFYKRKILVELVD